MENNTTLPTKEDVQTTPKDTVLPAKITQTVIETWTERLKENPETLNKMLSRPDGEEFVNKKMVFLNWETEAGYKGNEIFGYYEEPSDLSKLGQALLKYGSLNEGEEIKIHFNSEGEGKIQL